MQWGVVTFPGSNDDAQTAYVLERLLGERVVRLWHKDTALGGVDCVVLPGGFSYGDYLRCGAMARFSPIMRAVEAFAGAGGIVLGICNGFQILCEAGLLPGALVRNRDLTFLCRRVHVRVEETETVFTHRCRRGEVLDLPVKHGEGCYVAEPGTLAALEAGRQILLRYCDAEGRVTPESNPNGSLGSIAGIRNARGNVFGMMPHPEHAAEWLVGGEDGRKIFQSIAASPTMTDSTAPPPSAKVVSGP
jgi:phosphoribosylformylglycinamidine synthase subunit PurQ / glutaminase